MSAPMLFGTEFLVNTTTTGMQSEPVFTGLANGKFLATWASPDLMRLGVYAQIFNADGSLSGPEFQVNTYTPWDQNEIATTALDNGGFVVTWMDDSWNGPGDSLGKAVRAQIYDAAGGPVGTEFLVNTTTDTDQSQPAITTLADGRFVISWSDQSATGGDVSATAVRAQIFNPDGGKSGAEFLVNSTTLNDQYESDIIALTNGGFVISWSDSSVSAGDASGLAVRAQIFGANGAALGSEFLVNTTTAGAQYQSTMTALADDRFVISWADNSTSGADTSLTAIRAQIYNGDGTRSGGEFLVNTTVFLGQLTPTLAALADGRFVAAWTDTSATGGDTSYQAVRAQVFNFDGSPSGSEFLVNTETLDDQNQPTIAVLADGRFVIGWQDASATGGDTSGSAIRAQIFDPREAAVQLFGSTLDDDFVGTAHGDQLYGFIGDDVLQGRNGSDLMDGEDGDDLLTGGNGNDRMFGGAGNDTLRGSSDSDQLYGGDGNDFLNGGFGIDYAAGGKGNDNYVIDQIGDIVFEAAGQGADLVRTFNFDIDLAQYANVEHATLLGSLDLGIYGSAAGNKLVGNTGSNTLFGFDGKDNLNGGGGADHLIGGLGRDVFTGGTGSDAFIFTDIADSAAGSQRDVIVDFNQAQFDQIVLADIDAQATTGGHQSFVFIGNAAFSGAEGEVRYENYASVTTVMLNVDGDIAADMEIQLRGVFNLQATDFLLDFIM